MENKKFKNMTAVRKVIRKLKQSEALAYKLAKFGATLMPARSGVSEFTVFCYTPSTVNPNDEYELSQLVCEMAAAA